MLELPKDLPWLHEMFVNEGFHAVHKRDRYWTGLWTDLVIEQVMMRSIKSQGGLTRGIGITECPPSVDLEHAQMCRNS